MKTIKAEHDTSFERLQTAIERNSKQLMVFMAVLFGVATAVLGFLLSVYLRQPGIQ